MNYRDTARSRDTVATLMDLTLLGRYRLRTALPAK
jgi:hypothetical protein